MYKLSNILQRIARHSGEIITQIYIIIAVFRIGDSPYLAEVTQIGTIVALIVCFCKIYSTKQNSTVWGAIKQSKYVIFFTVGMLILCRLSLNLPA